jgi:Fur family ferric uptake transcriptional regulator
MTTSSLCPPLTASSSTAAVSALRALGMRISAARRLVIEALYSASGPVSAEAIAKGLDGVLPPSDLGSVYRNLETLEEVGLVQHVHLGHGPGLYAIAGRHTGWAVCDACGRHVPLDADALRLVREAVRAATGFDANFSHFPIVGLCPECSEQPATARACHSDPGGGQHAHP